MVVLLSGRCYDVLLPLLYCCGCVALMDGWSDGETSRPARWHRSRSLSRGRTCDLDDQGWTTIQYRASGNWRYGAIGSLLPAVLAMVVYTYLPPPPIPPASRSQVQYRGWAPAAQ